MARARYSSSRTTPPSHVGIEENINNFRAALRAISAEMEGLKERHRELERKKMDTGEECTVERRKLDVVHEGELDSPESQIARLAAKIKKLEATNQKQKKQLREFKEQELKREADDLNTVIGDHDPSKIPEYRMRRWLRKFSSLMSYVTIGGDEECVVCTEMLELNECSALPCDHTYCDDCLGKLFESAQDAKVLCPECRQSCLPGEVKTVTWTEQARWDGLIDIAANFQRMDTATGEGTHNQTDE